MHQLIRSFVIVAVVLVGGIGLTSVLESRSIAEQAVEPLNVLLVTGGCCHDYETQKGILSKGIAERANVKVTVVHDEGANGTKHKVSIYKKPNWWKGYDVVIHDECFASTRDKDFVDGILAAHRAGVPAVNLHCAMHCYRVDFDKYKDWFAMTGVDSRGHGPQLPIEITYTEASHPITRGLSNWTTIKEELYDVLEVWPNVTVLAHGDNSKQDAQPLVWVNEFGPKKTRVFSTTLGHNNDTVSDDRYLDLITRGVLWTTGKLGDDGQPLPGYGK